MGFVGWRSEGGGENEGMFSFVSEVGRLTFLVEDIGVVLDIIGEKIGLGSRYEDVIFLGAVEPMWQTSFIDVARARVFVGLWC